MIVAVSMISEWCWNCRLMTQRT